MLFEMIDKLQKKLAEDAGQNRHIDSYDIAKKLHIHHLIILSHWKKAG